MFNDITAKDNVVLALSKGRCVLYVVFFELGIIKLTACSNLSCHFDFYSRKIKPVK